MFASALFPILLLLTIPMFFGVIGALVFVDALFAISAFAFTALYMLALLPVYEALDEKHAGLSLILSLLFDFMAPVLLYCQSRDLTVPAAEDAAPVTDERLAAAVADAVEATVADVTL
jgi:hypothetical protein